MARLIDASGVVVFEGEIEDGGSQPEGTLRSADFLFTEVATPGTYTAAFEIPVGATVVDVAYWLLADWTADTAAFTAETTETAYTEDADVRTGTARQWNSAIVDAQGGFAYVAPNFDGRVFAVPVTLTLTVVTTEATPPVSPTGILRVRVLYVIAPTTATDATFA